MRRLGMVTRSPTFENSTNPKPDPRLSACSRTITLLAAPRRLIPPDSVLAPASAIQARSEEHTSELQSPYDLVCRLLLEKKKIKQLSEGSQRRILSRSRLYGTPTSICSPIL